jgi:hypothetical protein
MGAWGPAVFSDDLACDVRDDYRRHVGDGMDGERATDALLEQYRQTVSDPDDGTVFWLALAATQWKVGRLEPRVLQRALEIIDADADLHRWKDDAGLLRQRKAALTRLRVQITSPQRTPTRIRKAFRASCDWKRGEVVAYTLRSGRRVLLHVLRLHTDKGGTSPVCEILDWVGTDIPLRRAVTWLGRRTWWLGWPSGEILIGAVSVREYPADRLERTGIKVRVRGPHRKAPGTTVMLWRRFDQWLEARLGLA